MQLLIVQEEETAQLLGSHARGTNRGTCHFTTAVDDLYVFRYIVIPIFPGDKTVFCFFTCSPTWGSRGSPLDTRVAISSKSTLTVAIS